MMRKIKQFSRNYLRAFKIFDYQYTIIVNINHIFSEAFNFFSSIRFLLSSQYIVASNVENLQIKYVHFSNQSEHLRSRKTEREKERKKEKHVWLFAFESSRRCRRHFDWQWERSKVLGQVSTWQLRFCPVTEILLLELMETAKRSVLPSFLLASLSSTFLPSHHRRYRTESFGCE